MKLINEMVTNGDEKILRVNPGSIKNIAVYDTNEPEFVVYIYKMDNGLYRETYKSYDPTEPLCEKCGGPAATLDEIQSHQNCQWVEYDELELMRRINVSLENPDNAITIQDSENMTYLLSATVCNIV